MFLQHAYEAVHYIIFDEKDVRKENFGGYWLIGLLAPEQNYILVSENDKIIYSYGNESLNSIGKTFFQESDLNFKPEFTYTGTLENDFVHFEKNVLDDKIYQLYFVSERSLHDEDEALEDALEITIGFVIIYYSNFS